MALKKRSSGGGANWMDTYGDLVTLLLCFFVLLYSMSNIDKEKWMVIVQSFNKNALVSTDEEPRGPDGDNKAEDGGGGLPAMEQEEVDEAIEELYAVLASMASDMSSDLSGSPAVSVNKGDGFVFISFNDSVFFGGDSYELLPAGRQILDEFIPALNEAAPYIDEIRIQGHTAQARADRENTITGDRFLASNRATAVTCYVQANSDVDPARLIVEGYGQWRPISSNETAESRAKNRRVEMVISGLNVEDLMGSAIQEYYTTSGQEKPGDFNMGTPGGAERPGMNVVGVSGMKNLGFPGAKRPS